jgi:hypothetical protein
MIRHARFALFALAFASACGSGTSASSVDVAATAALAKKIRANPSGADAILSEAGTTSAQFEADLYTIARDPDASKAYAKALGE